jgi:hypothetical protein
MKKAWFLREIRHVNYFAFKTTDCLVIKLTTNIRPLNSHEEVLSLLKRLDIQDGYHGLLIDRSIVNLFVWN